jgi:hypothetical protein
MAFNFIQKKCFFLNWLWIVCPIVLLHKRGLTEIEFVETWVCFIIFLIIFYPLQSTYITEQQPNLGLQTNMLDST